MKTKSICLIEISVCYIIVMIWTIMIFYTGSIIFSVFWYALLFGSIAGQRVLDGERFFFRHLAWPILIPINIWKAIKSWVCHYFYYLTTQWPLRFLPKMELITLHSRDEHIRISYAFGLMIIAYGIQELFATKMFILFESKIVVLMLFGWEYLIKEKE